MSALSILLDALVDYAGLFPPAKLPMGEAVRNYAAYRRGPQAACLGRFVIPLARLAEFETEHGRLPGTEQENWKLTAIAGTDAAADAGALESFNQRHSRAHIASVEMKAATVDAISRAVASFPPGTETWVEIPTHGDVAPLVAAIRAKKFGAKIRTGGVTPEAFPPARDVARFMLACRQNNVVFKATAGLHHPLRGEFPLTYEPGSPRATMYGFLNVLLAAILITDAGTEAEAVALLNEVDTGTLSLTGDAIAWNDHRFTSAQIAAARISFCRSFGSCSFTEPTDGLRQLSWL